MRGLEQIPWLYDLGLALLERGGLGRWRAWLAGGARGRVLDLGTGTGRNLPLLPRDAAAIAVDPHRANLARARRRAPRVPLVLARAEALPFRDGAFDTVVSGLVLCSVEDVPRALAEVRRVLAPSGTLRALEHVRGGGALGALQDRTQPAWTTISGGCHPNRETERALHDAGFEIDPASIRSRGVMRRLEARPPEGSASAPASEPSRPVR
ncbi:class I SAM-dependent methyltransferase [Anaeromyxobacter sp. Fw109-5]|uniref:class I SAM-dependent methyltransferase n=1 Tax=Anaeromyxobacter sp. (strain Fw109-5) TaxID=404589 RepID=UPI000158A4B1|nr:class I SAM-dependent methyltransferase [Anaeromyxobacter sp. Fw109-5]ABS26165.1 Methyltransferase type 11 [Anaeromyxobacter sp. Fw109-5]